MRATVFFLFEVMQKLLVPESCFLGRRLLVCESPNRLIYHCLFWNEVFDPDKPYLLTRFRTFIYHDWTFKEMEMEFSRFGYPCAVFTCNHDDWINFLKLLPLEDFDI